MLALSPGVLLSYGRRFLFVLLLLVGLSLASSIGGDSGNAFAPRAYANPSEDLDAAPRLDPDGDVSPEEDIDEPEGYTPNFYRARHGQVYQVLQHRNSNEVSSGAEITRVMMVVGSTSGVGSCNAAGSQSPVQQAETLAATTAGSAFPINSVYKSAVIPDASPPCFNYDGPNRDGLVCIGPDCSTNPDPFILCTCAPGDDCVSFTITNPSAPGVAPITLTTDTPAATLTSPAFTPPGPQCPFPNRVTYSFGTAGAPPTTNEDVCSPPPADGFNLPGTPSIWPGGVAGSTIIIAYNVSPSFGFNLAEAVFHVDTNGINPAFCAPSTGSVVGAAAANRAMPPPLLAQIESFTATSLNNQILVEWATSSEVNNLGFNLYRNTTNVAPSTPLNEGLIPSQAPGGGQGFSYEWLDTDVVAGESYHYWLEDVDVDGTRTLHEPIVVTHQPPTAVTLATLDAARPTRTLPWLLLAGAVGAGLVTLYRRRRTA